MKNRVITISREFGSGGRTIGKKVAEQLGIPCYDAEIIQKMVKELINLLDEQDRPTLDMEKNYWSIVIDSYLHNPRVISGVDKRYGAGVSHFLGTALEVYFH